MTKSGLWWSQKPAAKKAHEDCAYVHVGDVLPTATRHSRARSSTCRSLCCGMLAAAMLIATFSVGFFAGSCLGHLWHYGVPPNSDNQDALKPAPHLVTGPEHVVNKRAVLEKVPLNKRPFKQPVRTSAEEKVQPASTVFSFEDVYDQKLRPSSYGGSWWDDDDVVYQDNLRNVYSWNVTSGQETLLIPNTTLIALDTDTYLVSARRTHTYALIAYNVQKQWRHSYHATYRFYNTSSGETSDFPNSLELANKTLEYAAWSPTSHSLVFVYNHNVYIQLSPRAEPQQVTFNGDGIIYFNGVPDWMYEEDVLGSRVALSWSPDSQYLMYAEFNDTDVPTQDWPVYGQPSDIYSTRRQIAYPKAGDTSGNQLGAITQVRLFAVNITNVSMKVMLDPADNLANRDHYYTRMDWRDATHAYVVWSNRASNETFAYIYDVTTGTKQLNNEHSVIGGWVDSPYPQPWFIDGGNSYITILPKEEGQSGSWPHVALVTAPLDASGDVTFLSSGEDQNVWSIVGVQGETVYFTATNGDPKESHLFSVSISDGSDPVCLTCDNPDTCRFVSTSFSGSGRYYIESCLGPDIPSYRLKSSDGTTDTLLEDNADVRVRLTEKQLPTREFVQIQLDDGNTDGWAEIFTPANFTEGTQYRLFVYVYGGPNSQLVTRRYPMGSTTRNYLRHLSSAYNIVVASVDGRGTTGRGNAYLHTLYRKLGDMEVVDQLTAVDYFKSLDYIDASQKAAIFGWSYGGQCASQCLVASSDDQFQCAIAVAPVTTKRYYDSAYTERYMAFDIPDDNQAGYNNTDIIRKAEGFRDKAYLLAHGTADDNVHYMQTAKFVKALVDAEIQFRQLMYVDEAHSITTLSQSRHLFRAMTDFVMNDCYQT